jgi:predicted Zn-dependent protease
MSEHTSAAAIPKYASKDFCVDTANRVIGFATRKGDTVGTSVTIMGDTSGTLRWARNQVSAGTQLSSRTVAVVSVNEGQEGMSITNEIDDSALKGAAMDAERLSGHTKKAETGPGKAGPLPLWGPQDYAQSNVFYESSIGFDTQARSTQGVELVQTASGQGFMSYGYMANWQTGTGVVTTNKLQAYQAQTDAEFSVTVRSRAEGSGWAGLSHSDFSKIDVKAVMNRAIDKCKNSQNPLRMEPGRHLAILEPQAVYDMWRWAMMPPIGWGRRPAEMGFGPYAAPGGKTKIGQKMLDERLTVYADPVDAGNNYRSFADDGSAMRRTVWFEKGILKELPYNREYAVEHKINEGNPMNGGISPTLPIPLHMTGGDTTIDEMIRTTRNGFLVTRFNGVFPTDFKSLSCQGNTRDGFWFIENGKIKHAAKNFRMLESPFFMLNQLESVGEPQRVYTPRGSIMVPPVKVRNFNFTALVDAV